MISHSQTDGTAPATATRHPRLIGRAARRFAPLVAAVIVLAALAGGATSNASAGVRFNDGAEGYVTLVCDQRTGQARIDAGHMGRGWNMFYDFALYRNGVLVRDFTSWISMGHTSVGGGSLTPSYGNRWQMLVAYAHVTNDGSILTYFEWAPVAVINWTGRTDYGNSYRACIA